MGVLADPEVIEFKLNKDSFAIIASDGVWEFLSNDQVAIIVAEALKDGSPEHAANTLVRESFLKWKKEEDVIDDITCVIIIFK